MLEWSSSRAPASGYRRWLGSSRAVFLRVEQYVSVAVGGQSHKDVSRPLGLTNPARLRGDSIYTFVLP